MVKHPPRRSKAFSDLPPGPWPTPDEHAATLAAIETRAAALADPDPEAARQLVLAFVPDVVRAHGLGEAHPYPLASSGKRAGRMYVKRQPAALAWKRAAEIELRTANSRPVLILDVDRDPGDYFNVALSAAVRPPNWVATSPATGHAHIVYTLARAVLFGPGMRRRPLQKFARIAEYYADAFQADRAYRGILTHNPTHPRYADSTSWLVDRPWTLDELAEAIPKGWRTPPRPRTAEGRNSWLFAALMKWYGRPSHWTASLDLGEVHNAARRFNRENSPPLDGGEVWGIAKSVARYCRANFESGQTQRNFPFIQATRGRKSGAARRKGTALEADRAPWEAEGVSRRAWFYRQAAQHTGKHGGARRR